MLVQWHDFLCVRVEHRKLWKHPKREIFQLSIPCRFYPSSRVCSSKFVIKDFWNEDCSENVISNKNPFTPSNLKLRCFFFFNGIVSKATNAPDTDKASAFRLGNGVPLQGLGLLVDGPRNQGVAHYGKQDGRRKLHHPVAVGSKFQCSCLGFIGMTRTIAYVIFLRFHVFILHFSNIVHVSHSSFTPQQQLRHLKQSSRACHELCLTMEEEEVVAVGFPSPVDDLKVPDKQLVSSEWGTPWILWGILAV